MRSARLIAVAVLAVVLALSSAQNAFAKIELAYDDGTIWGSGVAGGGAFAGVRFSLPSELPSAQILYIRFDWTFACVTFDILRIHITGSDHVTELTAPIGSYGGDTGTGCPAAWTTPPAGWPKACGGVDVSGLGIVVTGDFYVVLESLYPWPSIVGGNPVLDRVPTSARSFEGNSLAGLTPHSVAGHGGNWLIRVDIGPPAPVGGIVMPVNTFAVLSPWLAVIGLVGCIGTVVVVAKKCRQ